MKKLLLLSILMFCSLLSAQDGFLDSTFGNNGIVTTCLLPDAGHPSTIEIQPDHKIIVAGSIFHAVDDSDFFLARYLENGTLDPDFGNGGVVMQ